MGEANESLLDHAWRHFDFHAKQRLSLFNFCIIWAGLIIAAWSQAMTGATPRPIVGVILGVLLVISAVVFWRMDQRNAHLTKMSEGVLGEAETAAFSKAVLFNTNQADAQLRKGLSFLGAPQWSHGQSLKVLFGLIAIAGVMGTIFAWTALYSHSPSPKHAAVGHTATASVATRPQPRSTPPTPPPSAAPR